MEPITVAPYMFAGLVIFLLIGYPVAFSLAAVGLIFGLIGIEVGLFRPDFLQALPERVYGMLKPRTRLIIDILGTLMFLIPTCAVGGWLTFWFFWDSWQTGEQAANAAGLPRWPAKLMFPLGFGLLLLQAVSELIKRCEALAGHFAFDTSYEKPVQ